MSRSQNRLVELQLIQDKMIKLMSLNKEFSLWLLKYMKENKVDDTLMQYIYDIKDAQIDVANMVAKFIVREYSGGELYNG